MRPDVLLLGAPERIAAVSHPGWSSAPLPLVGPDGIAALRGYSAAILLTEPGEAPWGVATMLYLAGVPIRIGRSVEFGGALLSRCLPADASDGALVDALDGAIA